MSEIGELVKVGINKAELAAKELLNSVGPFADGTANFIKDNLGTIGAGVGGVAVGAAVATIAANSGNLSKKSTPVRRKNRKSKAYSHKKRRHKVKSSKRRRNSYARTAGKRKDTSHRRIRQTKNGQPYIILASGKARFIKKSSARNSRKRKGGRY